MMAIDTGDPTAMVVEAETDFPDGTWGDPFVANGNVYNGFRFGFPKTTPLFRVGDHFTFGQSTTLSSTSIPRYHWRGWARIERSGPSGVQGYIVMSDCVTSASLGGLFIYDESGQAVGSSQRQISGENIVIDSSGRWCFQIDNGDRSSSLGGAGAAAQSVRCWDLIDPTNPTLVGTVSTGALGTAGVLARDIILNATEEYLLVSCSDYGLRVVDVRDPAAPSLVPSATRYGLNQPNKSVRGLVLYQPEVLAMTATENGVSRVSLWNVSDPTSPRKISDVTPPGVTVVTDLDVRFGRVFATVVSGGIPQLQVWY
jgi:hypothetical protein